MINIVRTNLVRADQRGKSTEVYQQKEVAPEDFQSAQVEGGNMVTMVMQALDKRLTGGDSRFSRGRITWYHCFIMCVRFGFTRGETCCAEST